MSHAIMCNSTNVTAEIAKSHVWHLPSLLELSSRSNIEPLQLARAVLSGKLINRLFIVNLY